VEEGAEGGEEGQAGSSGDRLSRDRLTAATPFVIVTVVGLWLTRSFWFPGRYVVGFDTYAYSGPNLEVTERALRNWRLPILDDLIFGGVPHLGNPPALALYPPQVLTLFLGTNRSMGILVAGHVVLLGVGMVLLARRLGMSRIGATSAALIAMAAGSTLSKSVQFEQILVIAWIPMLLVALHAVLNSSRPWRAVAALSATTAAILLAGHPQLVYQTVVLALAATIGFAYDDQRWRRLGHVAAGAALGACIALPQLVAVLFATADSAIKGGRDLDQLLLPALSLTPRASVRAFLGTVQDRDHAIFAGGFEGIAFIGVVVALLVAVGLVQAVVSRRSRPWAIALAAAALLSLTWAIGPRTPIYRLAYEIVPGFDLARASARWVVIVVLVAALFAGVGIDVIWRGAQRRHIAAAASAIAVVVGLVALDVVDTVDRRSAVIWAVTAAVAVALLIANTAVRSSRVARGTAAAVLVLAGLELTVMSVHSIPQAIATDTPFTDHRTATTEFLMTRDAGFVLALTDDGQTVEYEVPGMRPNANILAGVPSIDGYDGGVQITERWADALRRFQPSPPIELPLRNSLTLPIEPEPLARLGVRYILLDNKRPPDVFIPGWEGPLASDENWSVWENPAWLGDAVAWPAAIASDDPAELLRETPQVAALAAIVSSPEDAFDCTGGRDEGEPAGVAVERRRPEQIDLTVDTDRRTVVSVAQQALSGWNVEVDGRSADVVVVDGLFLGVQVPEGRHDIRFTYSSPWLTTTLVISLLAIAATIALVIGDTVSNRRRISQAAGGGDR
jgi:hypothetical protein